MLTEFLSALLMHMTEFIHFPKTEEEILSVKSQFFSRYGFPNVIGAIDGTHIAIQKPNVWDAYAFFNRKAYYSINVQAVCDANYKFTDLVVRWPGSNHDSHMYKNSGLRAFLHSPNLPENSWLLGDNGYPLEHCLMTPIIYPTTPEELRYNEAHRKTRKVIEQSFGILKSRFRIISKSGGNLCYNLQKCTEIITYCFILHNISVMFNIPIDNDNLISSEDNLENPEDNNHSDHSNKSSRRGDNIREGLVNYTFSNSTT